MIDAACLDVFYRLVEIADDDAAGEAADWRRSSRCISRYKSAAWARSAAAETICPRCSASGPTRCANASAALNVVFPDFRGKLINAERLMRLPSASVAYNAAMISRCHFRNLNRAARRAFPP